MRSRVAAARDGGASRVVYAVCVRVVLELVVSAHLTAQIDDILAARLARAA